MNMAFEITEDDVRMLVQHVFQQNAVPVSDNKVSEAFDLLDFDAVEQAALNGGCEMDEQTTAAYAEITTQLIDAGLISVSPDLTPA